jgi:hypothetical protein
MNGEKTVQKGIGKNEKIFRQENSELATYT